MLPKETFSSTGLWNRHQLLPKLSSNLLLLLHQILNCLSKFKTTSYQSQFNKSLKFAISCFQKGVTFHSIFDSVISCFQNKHSINYFLSSDLWNRHRLLPKQTSNQSHLIKTLKLSLIDSVGNVFWLPIRQSKFFGTIEFWSRSTVKH